MLEVQGSFYVTEEVGGLTKPNDVLKYTNTTTKKCVASSVMLKDNCLLPRNVMTIAHFRMHNLSININLYFIVSQSLPDSFRLKNIQYILYKSINKTVRLKLGLRLEIGNALCDSSSSQI